MRNRSQENQKGFIAVTSALVIAVLLLAVTLSLSFTGFFSRFNVLYLSYKEKSYSLAEACANTALLKRAIDGSYVGPETIYLGTDSCNILSIVKSGSTQIIVKVSAQYPQGAAERAYTDLVITADSSDMGIVTWSEVPKQT
ncbi:MAG: hypothetical protein KGJ89_02805 [Patescibacteria group bacterium]|nr:hypothetical protein [Patescibacteria group bacterium]MDE2015520.1 hypothetical protein [Patescibacteria group bacterium]MDE2226864.1 hypothetical protein [Patescibacteria group bacterium]